jgi:hypothetical protein
MPGLADAQQLKIDPAGGADCDFICRACIGDAFPCRRAVGDMDVFLSDVYVRKKILPHVPAVAVRAIGRHGVVLVEIERDDTRKIDLARLMTADQLFVHAQRGAAGREAEDCATFGLGLALNHVDDAVVDRHREVGVFGKDDGA